MAKVVVVGGRKLVFWRWIFVVRVQRSSSRVLFSGGEESGDAVGIVIGGSWYCVAPTMVEFCGGRLLWSERDENGDLHLQP